MLSNRAWPGAERKSVRNTLTSCTEVPQGAGLMGSASFFSRLGTSLRTQLSVVQWVRQSTCHCQQNLAHAKVSKCPAISQHHTSRLLYLSSPQVTSFSPQPRSSLKHTGLPLPHPSHFWPCQPFALPWSPRLSLSSTRSSCAP